MPSFTVPTETVFTWAAPPIKFGLGATDEIGHDVASLGLERVCIVTDPGVAATGVPQRVQDSLRAADVESVVYDKSHVEPTDESIRSAVEWARQSAWSGFVGVGGGSSIDTAKAMNLLTSNPGDLMDYVNKPIGEGRAPVNRPRPLVAVPTTAGTGSESTPVCVLDLLGLKVKSGISHPALRPVLAVIDPLNTLSMPAEVTAATGMDVLCHALESYTARPFDSRPAIADPSQRVAYCGSNPISDLWSGQAITLLGRWFRPAVHNGHNLQARTNMMLAATYAGIGFGNAGVHIPHACGYPIAGMVRSYKPAGYPEAALVPHGQSVSICAPAAFRWTFVADEPRHLRAAEMLGQDNRRRVRAAGRNALSSALVDIMRDVGIPNGLNAVGYSEADLDSLVAGTMKQQRLLTVSPRPVTEDAIAAICLESMVNW